MKNNDFQLIAEIYDKVRSSPELPQFDPAAEEHGKFMDNAEIIIPQILDQYSREEWMELVTKTFGISEQDFIEKLKDVLHDEIAQILQDEQEGNEAMRDDALEARRDR